MGVLKLLLRILLIIGKIVLVLLLILLALIVLVLCAPFCYRAQLKKDAETMSARAGVSWLWIVLRATFRLEDGKTDFEVRLFGIPLMRILKKIKAGKSDGAKKASNASGSSEKSRKKRKDIASGTETSPPSDPGFEETDVRETVAGAEPETPPETEAGAEPETPPETEVSAEQFPDDNTGPKEADHIPADGEIPQPESPGLKERRLQKQQQKTQAKEQKEAARQEKQEAAKARREASKQERREKKEQRAGRKAERSGQMAARIQKVKEIWELLRSDMFSGAMAVVKKRGILMMRHVMPRKLKGYIRYGFDDPSMTGKVTGILAMIYPRLPKKLKVYPEFSEACLEADLDIRGHVILIYLVIQALKVLFDRNVRELIKTVRHKDGKSRRN